MDLPIPIFNGEKIYNIVEIKKPTTGVLTVTYEAKERGNNFKAVLEFVSGCIESITSLDGDVIDSKSEIKRLTGMMPYVSAETLALKIMALINEDDVIEGVYYCPRCGKQIVDEIESEIDQRPRISELEVNNMDISDYNNEIFVSLDESIKFRNKDTKEIIEEIENFSIRFPTLNDCILACQGMREGQEVKRQLKVYANSIIKINKIEVNKKWIATWGTLLFSNMFPGDFKQISKVMQRYGLKQTIEKTCCNCGKVWNATINTSNFFASGLQST